MTPTNYKNCQSCGMPLKKDPQGGGSEADGTKSSKYCSYCYANGSFKSGDVSINEFAEFSKKAMLDGGMNSFFAWLFSRPFMIGHLERWKGKK